MTKEGQEIPSLDGLAYTPQHFIDTGSKMSDVLLALDGHKRPVALKIACVDQRARADVNRLAIKNTIDWLSKLRGYRGIVALLPIEFTGGPWWRSWLTPAIYCAPLQHWPGQPEFLVMEYIEGGSLRDFVGDKRLSLELALWIAHYIARALTYIHQRNCAHRDIKPENILFRTLPEASANAINSMPLLIDFGVAAAIGADRLVSGSRLWMAPELQDAYERRPLPVDPSWDLYALGLILCYMLTGRRPRHKNYEIQDYETFRTQTFAVLDRVETSEPRQATKDRVKQLIAKALDRQPENRPSAPVFATETANLLAELGSPLPLGERLRMRLEQNSRLGLIKQRWLVVAGALLLLLALCSLAGLAAQRGQFFIGFAVPDDPPTLATAAALSVASVSDAHLVTATVPIKATVPTTATAVSPTLAATFSPTVLPPTLAPFTPAVIEPAPTLVLFTAPATDAPPTLVPFTPTSTATDLPPTATPRPTFTPLPTSTARPTLTPSPASTRIVAPAVGRVQLLAPASAAHSAESKVLFTWQLTDQPLEPDHCFELVFWDPSNATDQRSPVGAGKATQRRVDFNLLTSNSDRLLRTLAQSRQNFNWGVRIVSCAKPANILKAVEEVRGYRYDGQ
ncbi:MAG: protein kinase [Chloroflexi bacterium]|nr:protein kinase [Chloroflexota bacterium]